MSFTLWQTDRSSRGSLAEVWIDVENNLCQKLYKTDGTSITGKQSYHTDKNEIEKLWNNEIHWSSRLKGEWLLETFEFGALPDDAGFYIIQPYSPDLIHLYEGGLTIKQHIPDVVDQIIEMFKFFQLHDMYKFNHAMSNLTAVSGKIKAFDFKYASARIPAHRPQEIHCIDAWLSKIDPTLKEKLRPYV
jgi:hypothetical protein